MKAELIKEEVVPVFKPMTVQVTIDTQEEYDAIQRAGESLMENEIKADIRFYQYTLSEREVWVYVLNLIAGETKNVN
tara:strand:- start:491 stop:721 length:231 start_codon:yes stop_codon:yes gene_type:complete